MTPFGPVAVPFPVTPSYRIRPDITRLAEPEAGHFVVDAAFKSYLEQKLTLLKTHPNLCRAVVEDEKDSVGLSEALWCAFEKVAQEHPSLVEVLPDGVTLFALGVRLYARTPEERVVPGLESHPTALFPALAGRVLAHLGGQKEHRLMDALALTMQEDYVIMRADRAECLHVCFPSHWNPATRAGQGFSELHRPVAHSEVLARAGPNVIKALLTKGPFVRYVWSLTADDGLNQNPDLPKRPNDAPPFATPAALAEGLTFRVERQTTRALPALGRFLFTVRIFTQPLTEAVHGPERRERLERALLSVDDALLAYKGLSTLRAPLLAWLRAFPSR